MNDVIEIHTVGDSCCLYNPRTNFLAVVNRSAKLIAELANAGKSQAEISRHIAALHGEEVAKISRIVNDTLAAIHDEGDGQANPRQFEISQGTTRCSSKATRFQTIGSYGWRSKALRFSGRSAVWPSPISVPTATRRQRTSRTAVMS